jgi:hypothetical protein
MSWDASPELMSDIRNFITPVRAVETFREVLSHDFPRECSNLPISGGWGYMQNDAIKFVRDLFPASRPVDFVSLEYLIAQKLIYEELIVFQPRGRKFSGIDIQRSAQALIEDRGITYDRLEFTVSCWSEWHWDQLKKEWEDNDFGKHPNFDQTLHAAKRDASQLKYDRELWFDITEVWNRA